MQQLDPSQIITPQITTVDNLFDPPVHQYIRERLCGPLTNWGHYPVTLARDPRLYDWYQYNHVIYDNDCELSDYSELAILILTQALARTGRRLHKLFKIRLVNGLPGELGRSRPHIDLVGPHQTGLYFPEDSDGTTDVMYERSWLQDWDTPTEYNVCERLEPRANTWYDFDGTHWRYTGRPQLNDQRFCLIFNFVTKPL